MLNAPQHVPIENAVHRSNVWLEFVVRDGTAGLRFSGNDGTGRQVRGLI